MNTGLDDEEVQLEQLIELVEGTSEELKQFIRDSELEDESLRRILRAERAAKNRKNVVNYLKRELEHDDNHTEFKEAEIGSLKAVQDETGETRFVIDIDGVKFNLDRLPMLEFGGHSFELSHPEKQDDFYPGLNYTGKTALNQNTEEQHVTGTRKISGTGKTGTDLDNGRQEQVSSGSTENRSQVSDKKAAVDQIAGSEEQSQVRGENDSEVDESEKEALLESIEEEQERRAENLREELREEFGVDQDLDEMGIDDLKQLKEDLEKREEKAEELKERFDVDDETLEDKDFDELQELEERLEELERKKSHLLDEYDLSPSEVDERGLEELEDLEQKMEKTREKRNDIAEKYDVDDSELEGKNLEELDSYEDRLKKKRDLIDDLLGYGYDKEELVEESLGELNDTVEELEKKEELVTELGADIEKGNLASIELEQLEQLKEEKQERKSLIEDLVEEGFDREKLEKSSTKDLRKLKADNEEKKGEQELEDSGETDEKDKEEISEEAAEDLEMLMGSVHDEDEDEDTEKDRFKAFKDVKKQFSNSWENLRNGDEEDEEESKKLDDEKMIELLEEYRDMDDRESAIKTAQVLKGYLETVLGIERELTYGELAENLREVERNNNIDTLIEFFETMEKTEYMGSIPITDMDPVINSAENTVSELKG